MGMKGFRIGPMMFKKFITVVFAGSLLSTGSCFAEDTPLTEKMDEVSGALKSLRRAKDDYAKCLELVREAQVKLLECFAFTPALVEKMPEGKEKITAVANYKKSLAHSYQTLCDLEIAYLSEDIDQIDDALDVVKKSRGDGHDELIEQN